MAQEITCKIESPLEAEYRWVMQVFAKYLGCTIRFVESDQDLLIAEHGMGDIQVSHFFRQIYQSGDFHFKAYFRKDLLHLTASGKPDYLSTCFYLLAYLQEYTDYHPDQYDRFPFSASAQAHFQCIEKNLVAEYFDALYASLPRLQQKIVPMKRATRVFLSHDIDHAFGAMRQNARYLLRKGRLGALMQLIFNHYLRTPDQLLLNKIMDIEDAHDMRSVFFWLVNSGKGSRRIQNADYLIDDARVRNVQKEIGQRGWINGLHKSVGRDTYTSELQRLGDHSQPVNRNHYLITELPNTFQSLEQAGITMDATFGFPEAIGFRNSYGLPIRPFDLKQKRAYSFLEVPLHVMDTTLRYYQKQDSRQAEETILNFLSRHPQNAIISILWHNNYFFEAAAPGWLTAYKNILHYLHENEISSILPDEVIAEFV